MWGRVSIAFDRPAAASFASLSTASLPFTPFLISSFFWIAAQHVKLKMIIDYSQSLSAVTNVI